MEVVLTRTGAHAILDRRVGEVMHPVGPLVESVLLYVAPSKLEERLAVPSSDPLVLFDIGLGAGSNALAAWRVSEAMPQGARRLQIVSFERDTSALELALDPQYAQAFALEAEPVREAAREVLANGAHETARTSWRLEVGDLLVTLERETSAADIVYWDMYSPNVNPWLWTAATFALLRQRCREGATLHTYSAATSSRAALLLGGFAVGVGPSTGMKAQTTMASTTLEALASPLDERWLERLARSSAPYPSDAPADALERIRALAQFTSSRTCRK